MDWTALVPAVNTVERLEGDVFTVLEVSYLDGEPLLRVRADSSHPYTGCVESWPVYAEWRLPEWLQRFGTGDFTQRVVAQVPPPSWAREVEARDRGMAFCDAEGTRWFFNVTTSTHIDAGSFDVRYQAFVLRRGERLVLDEGTLNGVEPGALADRLAPLLRGCAN